MFTWFGIAELVEFLSGPVLLFLWLFRLLSPLAMCIIVQFTKWNAKTHTVNGSNVFMSKMQKNARSVDASKIRTHGRSAASPLLAILPSVGVLLFEQEKIKRKNM